MLSFAALPDFESFSVPRGSLYLSISFIRVTDTIN
jgi:hypothetical protein